MKSGKSKKIIYLVIIIICVMAVDQLLKINVLNRITGESKTIIKGVLNLTYVENTGGAFGLGRNNIILFIIANIVIISIMLIYIIMKREQLEMISVIGYSLVISGGASNLLDRLSRGFVIDYIDINPLFNYPVFNFADICIVLGILIIAISLIFNRRYYETI